MASTFLGAPVESSRLIKPGEPSSSVIVPNSNQLPVTNSKKLTRLTRPVQVIDKSHITIYNSSNLGREQTFDNKGTSRGSRDCSDIPLDKICSHCNIGVVENNFTFAGVLLCVICFPFGFAWLFCMMESQCPHCGKIYL